MNQAFYKGKLLLARASFIQSEHIFRNNLNVLINYKESINDKAFYIII